MTSLLKIGIIICVVPVRDTQIEVWLSLVERCVRDAEAVGSSPVTSTNKACISYKDKRMYRFSVWRHSSAG